MLLTQQPLHQPPAQRFYDPEAVTANMMAPPAFGLDASPLQLQEQMPVNAPIQRVPEDEAQGENIVHENPFTRIATDQQLLIDRFASKAHNLAEDWGELRHMHTDCGSELTEKEYKAQLFQMSKAMHTAWKDYSHDFMQLERIAIGYNNDDELEAFGMVDDVYSYKAARKELARQLDKGNFPRYMREMYFFHQMEIGHHVINYVDLLESQGVIEFDAKPHKYTLETIVGLSGGAGEGVTLGGSVKGFTISYENDLGLSWKVNLYGASGKVGSGVSGSPIEANVEASTGLTGAGGGSAESGRYFSPAYLRWNVVSATSAEANMGAGRSVGSMSFGDLNFDISGDVVKFGTAVFGEVGAEQSLGVFRGGDAYDQTGIDAVFDQAEERKPKSKAITVIEAVVHFPTDSAVLDDADLDSLDEVVNKMLLHQAYFPGDIYDACVTGFSSPRWTTPAQSAKQKDADLSGIDPDLSPEQREEAIRGQLNNELAKQRAIAVAGELRGKLNGATMYQQEEGLEFDHGMRAVNDASKVRHRTSKIEAGGEAEITENDPRARAVYISVAYMNDPHHNLVYQAGGSEQMSNMLGGYQ